MGGTHHQVGEQGLPSPVIVVGNGPVGQTTALLLALYGISVIVLDARSERDAIGSKALTQQQDVLDVWSFVGVGHQLAEEGTTWRMARTFYRDRELFCHDLIGDQNSPFPPFVNISQTRTETLLDEQIARSELIDVRWSHHAVDIASTESGVTVACAVGPDRSDESAPSVFVQGSYAVVACGSRGRHLRKRLGVTFEGHSFSDQFLICDIRTDIPDWAHERRFYFDPAWNPGRQVLIHPQPDGQFRIDWQVPPDYDLDKDESEGTLDRRIREIIGDAPYEIVWKSVYRFHARKASRMRIGRVLLAGDVAHIVAPFGGRGLNSGVLDADNAAWKLAWVLRGWADDSILESYHDERLAAAEENLLITGRTMDFLVPQTDEAWRQRYQVLEAAVTDPEARARVDSGRLAEPFWYEESSLTTPSERHPFIGRPARGHLPPPAPGTVMPDLRINHPSGRLRTLLRGSLTVLAGSGVPMNEVDNLLAQYESPVEVHQTETLDPTGTLDSLLKSLPDEMWLIRPDAHIAAVPSSVDELNTALDRLLGLTS